MIDKSAIDPNALHFYRILKEAGFSAYFVGGSVRDLLLGKHPKDFDIATNATPHQIKRVIPQGRIIGRRFRHVMLEKGSGRYEIVTFRGPVVPAEEIVAELDDEALENQPLPIESASTEEQAPERGREKRYPDLNQFGNAEQDAIRRDFTINALFYDPDADELVDYVEGKLDIDRKLVRSIGDPALRMEEDPIRILRAIRHKMKLGLDYDPALEQAMREKSPLLETTSKDRIREEFLKVCNDQSLGDFLSEGRRMNLAPFIMPWFESVPEEKLEENFKLLQKFKEQPTQERVSPDMGLALMMIPLIEPLVLEPYRKSIQPGEKNQLPDMKYFLSCEPLRNYYLRNLRISRAQTDYLVRTLFYFSRMTGLWLEQGPPRRIIGKLFQHPSALLAARMARLFLQHENKVAPDWMNELADYDSGKKRRPSPREDFPRDRQARPQNNQDEEGDEPSEHEARSENSEPSLPSLPRSRDSSEPREQNKPARLPPPDQPLVWNGPLHAPVLRPVFAEEQAIRWSRKNQTVRAFRPSGIPNKPVDHTLEKSSLVYNYKPEIENQPNQEEEGRGGDRGRNRGRGRDRGDRGERGGDRKRGRDRGGQDRDRSRGNHRNAAPRDNNEQQGNPEEFQNNPVDEDSIGNQLRPGEAPAPLQSVNNNEFYDDEDLDDNIGNRLDAPPTSGHVGINGDGLLTHQQRGHNPSRGRNHGGGGGGGGNNRRRGGRRRSGGGRSGGPHRGGGGNGGPRGSHNNP